MARKPPSIREQARANFVKEEDLARARRGLFGKDLVLGSYNRKTGKGTENVVAAREFGPAVRGTRPRKRKKTDIGY